MPRTLLGTETGYRRELLFALELLDPGSLDTLTDGVTVHTPGSTRQALRNLGGHFVWVKGPDSPQRLQVDPGRLPFEPETIDLAGLAKNSLQLRLRPRPGYRPSGGALAVASSLYLERVDPPTAPQPVGGVDVWLQWLNDGAGQGGAWIDAEPASLTQPSGDFVCVLRLRPGDVPALDGLGALRARLCLRKGNTLRHTPEFALGQSQLQDLPPLHWSEL